MRLVPDSNGESLVEINRCHGPGRGHPCLVPRPSKNDFWDVRNPASFANQPSRPKVPEAPRLQAPKTSVKTVRRKAERMMAQANPGATMRWVSPLKYGRYPTGIFGWHGTALLTQAGFHPTLFIVDAEPDGSGMSVRPGGPQ